MKRFGGTPSEARQRIAVSDRRRSAYLKDSYRIDWDDPSLYHLVVNTGRVPLDVAAALIVEAVNQAVPATVGPG